MASIPKWALIAVPLIAVAGYAVLHFTSPDVAGRADACLGTTDPIQRGVMVNTCDHPISVLACPRETAEGECAQHSAVAGATFEVRADVAVIAHACRAPYGAVMREGRERGCDPAE